MLGCGDRWTKPTIPICGVPARAGARRRGGLRLEADDIVLVESAWSIPDPRVVTWLGAVSRGQAAVLCRDTLDDSGTGAAEELELVDLSPDQAYPVLDDDTGVFWYRPDQINSFKKGRRKGPAPQKGRSKRESYPMGELRPALSDTQCSAGNLGCSGE